MRSPLVRSSLDECQSFCVGYRSIVYKLDDAADDGAYRGANAFGYMLGVRTKYTRVRRDVERVQAHDQEQHQPATRTPPTPCGRIVLRPLPFPVSIAESVELPYLCLPGSVGQWRKDAFTDGTFARLCLSKGLHEVR